ncbi:restriction endonuclease subunit S [Lactiplantibacillus plantarum]|nr:restriction endonuclease subunit S [Lactiplantibacillus plantarum]MCG0599568.1 restriction endonuclease subunit S [Lactiplantibacillus plantarum]
MAKIDDSVKKKVPELRFKGFTDEWEDRKLSDIADRFDNLRVPITASDRKPGDTPYYGANGIQDYVEGFTHNGEFILVAEDGANDLKNYPVQYVNGKVWVNNHAHVLQGKKTITDNKFLMNAIKNFKIEPFLVGGGRAKLNADVMMKLNILLPTFVEQEKIGSLFSLLDKTIALHQRKLDLLKEQKKGYLQKMFPKNGAKVPELRFAGFADAWVQRKLSELASVTDTKHATAPVIDVVTKYRMIRTSSVRNGFLNENKTDSVTEETYEKWSERIRLQEGDVVFSREAPIGESAVIPKSDNNFFLGQRMVGIRTNENLNPAFLNETFLAPRFRKEVNVRNAESTTVANFGIPDIKRYEINVPSIEEQEKIGKLLDGVNNLIAANQHKLDLLKEQKKGFLQKMFV